MRLFVERRIAMLLSQIVWCQQTANLWKFLCRYLKFGLHVSLQKWHESSAVTMDRGDIYVTCTCDKQVSSLVRKCGPCINQCSR